MKRVKLTEELINEAHNYMEQWVDSDQWSDLAVILNEGDTELAADHLVSAGAIDSKLCYEWAQKIEKVIERLAKDFRKLSYKKQQERYDSVFKNTFVASCHDCNHVSFVNDGNETIYPEVKEKCWECSSKNIETYYWNDKK